MVGSTLPSHCTSMGRILLSALSADLREDWLSHTVLEPRTERTIVSADALRAELDIVAEKRWSLVEEELEPGRRSLAVPVRAIGRAAWRESGWQKTDVVVGERALKKK